MPVLLNLLWALLKASMVSEVFSVLSVSLAHKIVVSKDLTSSEQNVMLQYNLCSSRGHDMLFCKGGTNYSSCLGSLAMSSCWLSSTL